VRELENLLHRAVALNDGDELHLDLAGSDSGLAGVAANVDAKGSTAADATASSVTGMLDLHDVPVGPNGATAAQDEIAKPAPPTVPSDLQTYLDQQEREILVRALHESGFNRTAAAARLGLSLRQIRYRIARLGIATPSGDDGHGIAIDE
jgi:two-component system response regulator PilR (NtrC family)